MRSRPLPVSVAAIVLALFSVLYDLSFPLWAEAVPVFSVYLIVVVGVVGLVGAAGLWMLRKWGLWLAIVVCVLKLLDAASGVAGAPNTLLQVAAAVAVVGYILILVLVVLPTSRRALTTADQPSSRVR
jgi:uncharacterized membrane protein (DUF2068 family)